MTGTLPGEDRIAHYTPQLIAHARSSFPQRFYQGEARWRLHTAAAVLRATDMAEAVFAHMPARQDQDAAAALRSLYELAVTIAWVLIDPGPNGQTWERHALREELNLHTDLAKFDVGRPLLTRAQVRFAEERRDRLPAVDDRARQADDHWEHRAPGMRPGDDFLSFGGLYVGVYREGSRHVHGTISGLGAYITEQRRPRRFVVGAARQRHGSMPYALVSPLLALALLVVATVFPSWIDADEVRRLNDEATQPGPLR